MKYVAPAFLGMVASTATYVASFMPGIYGAALLLVGLFLWIAFIVTIVRVLKPE